MTAAAVWSGFSKGNRLPPQNERARIEQPGVTHFGLRVCPHCPNSSARRRTRFRSAGRDPSHSIPVLADRFAETTAVNIPDRPYVAAGKSRHSGQKELATGALVRAEYRGPRRSVPVLNESSVLKVRGRGGVRSPPGRTFVRLTIGSYLFRMYVRGLCRLP